ncbi:MAG TPA: carbohydrate kinase [Thermoleophilaceae bacterium]
MSSARLTVIGEALIDLVPTGPGQYRAHPGGSPFNVAVALARLGNRTALMARLSDHGFGRLLRETATGEGVDLSASARAAELTTLAAVSMDMPGQASYEFYSEGTADWQWSTAELRKRPTDTAVLHFGSIASWTPPGSKRIDQLVAEARARNGVLVSYDPNIRPHLLDAPTRGRRLVERSVRRSHVVKASREDIEWLYPSRSVDDIATRWNDLGAELVVVTEGPNGATAFREGTEALHRPGRAVEVVDTIGAGDAFTAGLLSGLVRRALHAPQQVAAIPDGALAEVVDEAVLVSSLTCGRAGADPPRLASAEIGARSLTVEDFATAAPA